MSYTGTEKTSLLIGTVSGDMTVDEMYGKIAQAEPAPAGVDIQVIHSDKDACFLAIICLKADEAAVEEAVRAERAVRSRDYKTEYRNQGDRGRDYIICRQQERP